VPVRSAKASSLLGRLVETVGAEVAPALAAFYVGLDRTFYVANLHPLDLLLKDAQALLTQMRTGYRAPEQRNQQRSGVHAGFARFATSTMASCSSYAKRWRSACSGRS